MAATPELTSRILQALRRQGGVLSSAELQEQLARALASSFWQAAAADDRVSDGFRRISADNLCLIGL